jgi:hypothetical protein
MDNCFGLDNEKRPFPPRPESFQAYPKEPVSQRQASPRPVPDKSFELLSQCQVLKQEITPRTEQSRGASDKNAQNLEH